MGKIPPRSMYLSATPRFEEFDAIVAQKRSDDSMEIQYKMKSNELLETRCTETRRSNEVYVMESNIKCGATGLFKQPRNLDDLLDRRNSFPASTLASASFGRREVPSRMTTRKTCLAFLSSRSHLLADRCLSQPIIRVSRRVARCKITAPSLKPY